MSIVSGVVCSFCGEDQTKVDTLIAGQADVYICNVCIDVCHQTVTPASTHTSQPHFEIIKQHMFCALLYNYDWNIIDNMMAWIKENDIRVWTRSSSSMGKAFPVEEDIFKIIFESESDLVAFKLRWI